MSNLLRYRLRCTTEPDWKYAWLPDTDPAPTTCPTDTAHSIEAGSVSIVGRQDEGRVVAKVEEESPGKETGGNYAAETIAWDATPGISSPPDVVLPLPIAMLAASIETKDLNDGDLVALDVAPLTTVGALPGDVAIGATTIPLPATMKAAYLAGDLWVGQVVTLDDGASQDVCGIILAFDVDADTFDVSIATVSAFAAATPTLVKITTTMSPGILGAQNGVGWVEVKASGGLEQFGTAKIGGTRINAALVIKPRFHNKGQANVRVVIRLEFLY